MPIRDALLVIFLDGYVTGMTGMTEMTKKMESRTCEGLPEVYRLAVILVICVIGGSNYYANSFRMN